MDIVFKDRALGEVKVIATNTVNFKISNDISVEASFITIKKTEPYGSLYTISLDTGFLESNRPLSVVVEYVEMIISSYIKKHGILKFVDFFGKRERCAEYWKYFDQFNQQQKI